MKNIIMGSLVLGCLLACVPVARAEPNSTFITRCSAKWKNMPGAKAWVLGVTNNRVKCIYFSGGGSLNTVTGQAIDSCRSERWNKCFLMGQGDRKSRGEFTQTARDVYRQWERSDAANGFIGQRPRQQQQQADSEVAGALVNGLLSGFGAGYSTGSQQIQRSRPQPRAAPTHNSGSSDNCDWSTGACSSQ
jgi:hypothetical protein